MKDVLSGLSAWFRSHDEPAAVAVVASIEGAAMRGRGSVMAILPDGAQAGSVSGGCIEAAVLEDGQEVCRTGQGVDRVFTSEEDEILGTMSPCGGDVRIVTTLLPKRLFLSISELVQGREGGVWGLVIPHDDESRSGLFACGPAGHILSGSIKGFDELIGRATERGLGPGLHSHPEADVFTAILAPSPQLHIVGATHLGVALSRLALQMNFDVQVVDPRTAFCRPERFAGQVDVNPRWPRHVFTPEGLTENSAFAVISHDPKIDDQALAIALESPAFYVGVLGSTKTQGKIRARLNDMGVGEAALDRIKGPIGLAIGAANPEEIALAIMAEVVAEYRSRFGRERDF